MTSATADPEVLEVPPMSDGDADESSAQVHGRHQEQLRNLSEALNRQGEALREIHRDLTWIKAQKVVIIGLVLAVGGGLAAWGRWTVTHAVYDIVDGQRVQDSIRRAVVDGLIEQRVLKIERAP